MRHLLAASGLWAMLAGAGLQGPVAAVAAVALYAVLLWYYRARVGRWR